MVKVNKQTLSTLIFLVTFLAVIIPQSSGSSSKGPRTEDLIMNFYFDVNSAYAALEMDEVDIVGFDIQQSIYMDAIENPNVVLAPVDDLGMYEFDINNNYTIPSNPGVRSPTNYKKFRQALAFLVDKDRIVEEFCNGFASRIDQPIAAATSGWMNTSYTGPNYPYEYDPLEAASLLDEAGFIEGSTSNTYYDPVFPGSTEHIRKYPLDHPTKPNQTLDDLNVVVRTDDPRRYQAGSLLVLNMRKIGIPVETNAWIASTESTPKPTCPYIDLINYHVYTGGWGLGRFPTYLYFLFHSDFWEPYGSNYVAGFEPNATGHLVPNHPELNALIERVYHADTFEEALKNTRNALGLFTELCVTIPLFSARAFWVYSSELLGTVNMESYAYDQDLFFLNVYKDDGSPIRWGHITPPNGLNIMYSSWTYDYQCLNRVYDLAGYDLLPYDIVVDQPGFVLDWFADTWDDNGTLKAKNFKKFRSDNYFVDTDGNQGANVDADDYLFSCYVHYAIGVDAWNYDTVQDVKYFNKVNQSFVEIFFDARSYWLYTAASPYLLPRSIWFNASHGLTENLVETFVVDTNLTTPGFMGLGGAQPNGPCWVNSIASDLDGTLIEWVDFHWELGDWYMDTPLTPGAVVTVDYYAIDDASGYTLGANPWEDVTIGCGMYYAAGFTPGVGGNFTAKRNPYYYLETPILGEVDFVWEEGGYYEVTIFDVVRAAGAYGSQGIAIPDDNWFPGADVAPPGGVIDIFDIVTIASAYGETFGAPPP